MDNILQYWRNVSKIIKIFPEINIVKRLLINNMYCSVIFFSSHENKALLKALS